MSVAITFSYSNGGAAISSDVDHGNTSNGLTTSGTEIYIRHDGLLAITAAKLYIRAYSGTYSGGASANLDFLELLAWGDAIASNTFGGFQVNMNATEAYPAADWPVYTDKDRTHGYVCRTGTADSAGNGVLLSTGTGVTTAGQVPTGAAPNIRFKVRVQIPTAEDTVGIRQWDQCLVFNYTS
jgi:hypothetical protein